MSEDRTAAKRQAGERAAEQVESGMVVGLGTGSTAAYAIRHLGERVDAGLDIAGIPTSYQSRELAQEVDIPLTSLDAASPDIAIDGADQVVDDALIKGGGAAHAREKIVGAAAEEFLIVVDESKVSQTLDAPVPVEVLPAARTAVAASISERGGDPVLRDADRKDGPIVTDNGNLVLDCDFGTIDAPAALSDELDAIPGVVAHGLFLDMADAVYIGSTDGVTVREY